MSDATISLCIIAKFDSLNFAQLVGSALGNVDEVLVAVDDGAEEGIYGFGEAKGVKYWRNPIKSDFSGQRNFVSAQATSNWLLFLDTDENLSDWLWPRLRTIADATVEDCISFPRRNHIVGNCDYWGWPDFGIRMFRKNGRLYWARTHHEIVCDQSSVRRLPAELRFAIHHEKSVERQRVSDEIYARMGPV